MIGPRRGGRPAVVAALGMPIVEGFFTSGNIKVSGRSGSADLAIPISGPSGSGTVFLEARKSAGQWSFLTLAFESEKTGERTDLLVESRARAVRASPQLHDAAADFLGARKREAPRMSDLLADLAKRVSGDATLEGVDVDEEDRIHLRGAASNTAKMVASLQG